MSLWPTTQHELHVQEKAPPPLCPNWLCGSPMLQGHVKESTVALPQIATSSKVAKQHLASLAAMVDQAASMTSSTQLAVPPDSLPSVSCCYCRCNLEDQLVVFL